MEQTWNLDSIYEGGSSSVQAEEILADLEEQLLRVGEDLASSGSWSSGEWNDWLGKYQNLTSQLEHLASFYSCCMAADTKDVIAKQKYGRVRRCTAQLEHVDNDLATKLAAMASQEWNDLVEKAVPELAFPLTETRNLQKEKLDSSKERIITSLSVDGFHGWSQFYDSLVGRLQLETEVNGDKKTLSVGQAENYFSHGSVIDRRRVFRDYEKTWEEDQELFAEVLNRISGFRLAVYQERGWSSHLHEALRMNRMGRTTLEAMWDGVGASKEKLIPYLIRKRELLQLDTFTWVDQDAPLTTEEPLIPYAEAADFIVTQFRAFNPAMAVFAEQALKQGWIEAEDRAGKMPGGFCTGFPETQESRIFMTYGGTYPSLSTLAHELGHAFHSHQLWGLPPLRQHYAMNVAETASTFGELLVSDAALANAPSVQLKLNLLDQRLQQAVALLMNIHARFLFENRLYTERKKGELLAEELSAIMLAAQKEAYMDSLDEYHSLFWASKLHFYLTDVPFYNFPYTFGYLFSAGLYYRLNEDSDAAQRYDALLRDTGSMSVEDLARKHLGVDLSKADFWKNACDRLLGDVDMFLKVSKED